MKKANIFTILLVLLFFGQAWAASPGSLSVTGAVRQPMNLSIEDLKAFQSVRVQLNEVTESGAYSGVFIYRGVPLRSLLELAFVRKEETAFNKKVDLAILVANSRGEQVALSWGEVFYRNPGGIIVAYSAVPIYPHKDCRKCHEKDVYGPRLGQLGRRIGFPKLVLSGDAFSDRSLEGITRIEVVDIAARMPGDRTKRLFSSSLKVTGHVKKPFTLKDLEGLPRVKTRMKHLGEGRGFHGIERFEGAPLKSVLRKAGIHRDLSSVFLVSAPDGYRSLFSYGEMYLDPAGDRMVLADRMNQSPIKKGGAFFLVPAGDIMSDRDVKSVERIRVVSLRKEPKLYVIGMGCGDTSMITLDAISAIARADAFVCPPDISKRFAKYLGGRPVICDIYEFVPPVLKKKRPDLSAAELEKLQERLRSGAAEKINKALQENRTVAILDYGDPTIWSGWSWARDYFDEGTIKTVAGLSSLNAANALIEKRIGCNGSVILTTPRGLMENRALARSMAGKGETVAVFMGLRQIPDLMPVFLEAYPKDTPACLVYKAGYSGSEHLIRTTLEGLAEAAEGYHEKFLGLIYIGPCLAPKKGDCGD